jgi:hypothetical protein
MIFFVLYFIMFNLNGLMMFIKYGDANTINIDRELSNYVRVQ